MCSRGAETNLVGVADAALNIIRISAIDLRVGDAGGELEAAELAHIAQGDVPEVVLSPCSRSDETGDRWRLVLDQILAMAFARVLSETRRRGEEAPLNIAPLTVVQRRRSLVAAVAKDCLLELAKWLVLARLISVMPSAASEVRPAHSLP